MKLKPGINNQAAFAAILMNQVVIMSVMAQGMEDGSEVQRALNRRAILTNHMLDGGAQTTTVGDKAGG